MDSQTIQETALGLEVIFKATMELYESYFQALEAAINKTPNENVEQLTKLHALVEEGQTALEADLATFDKIVASDMESLNKLDEELQIQSIYANLKQ